MKYVRSGLVANPKSSFTCLPFFNLSKNLKVKKFLTDLIQDIWVCELNSSAFLRYLVDIKAFILFVIQQIAQAKIMLELTGFYGAERSKNPVQ